MGDIVPFPRTAQPSNSLKAILDRATDLRWSDQQTAMAGVAREMLTMPTVDIMARIERILATDGGAGLMSETLSALDVTSREFESAALAIDAARHRLGVLVASARPAPVTHLIDHQ